MSRVKYNFFYNYVVGEKNQACRDAVVVYLLFFLQQHICIAYIFTENLYHVHIIHISKHGVFLL